MALDSVGAACGALVILLDHLVLYANCSQTASAYV